MQSVIHKTASTDIETLISQIVLEKVGPIISKLESLEQSVLSVVKDRTETQSSTSSKKPLQRDADSSVASISSSSENSSDSSSEEEV
jgi:hypothetical protein